MDNEFIEKIWNIAWDLWQHRNDTLHRQVHCTSAADSRELVQTITMLFGTLSRGLLQHNNRYILATPLATLLGRPLLYRKEWLQQAKTIMDSNRLRNWREGTRDQCSLIQMRNNLQAWLNQCN